MCTPALPAPQVFNFYTMNAWLVVFVTVLIVLPAWLWLFSDPTEANEHLAKEGESPIPSSCSQRGSACMRI